MRLLLVLFFCSLSLFNFSFASEKDSFDKQINQTYQKFINAFVELNVDEIDYLYDQNIIYISESKNEAIMQGSDKVKLIYQRFFDRVKQKNASLEIGFRILNRNITDEQATDIGYYIIRFIPSQKSEEPVSEFAGKFLIISKKAKTGQWLWSMEMNNSAKLEHYFSSKKENDLFYSNTTKIEIINER